MALDKLCSLVCMTKYYCTPALPCSKLRHTFFKSMNKSQSSILRTITITITINKAIKQQQQQNSKQQQQQQQTWNFQEKELLLFSLPLRYLARKHQPAVEVKASWCVTRLPNSVMHCTHHIQRQIILTYIIYLLYLMCTPTHTHSLSYIDFSSWRVWRRQGAILWQRRANGGGILRSRRSSGSGRLWWGTSTTYYCIICDFLSTTYYFSLQSHMAHHD